MEGRTTFVIAHRLATIRDADGSSCSTKAGSWRAAPSTTLVAENGRFADLAALSSWRRRPTTPRAASPSRPEARQTNRRPGDPAITGAFVV